MKEKKYKRNCPECGKELWYTTPQALSHAKVRNKCCISCARKKSSYIPIPPKPKSGKDNPMFGKNVYDVWLEKYGEEEANKRFEDYKRKQSDNNKKGMSGKTFYDVWLEKYGKEEADRRLEDFKRKQSENNKGEGNPMFGKPTPQGSGNGWSGWYKDWYFRSLRELSYMINHIEANNLEWESAERKIYKIPYIDYKGDNRTYTADFVVDGFLVEVKPKKLMESPTNIAKKNAAIKFCQDINLEYIMVDPIPLSDHDIDKMVMSGKIKFTKRYHDKWLQRKKGGFHHEDNSN